MKIGIDLDDVTWEHFKPALEYINETQGTDYRIEKLDSFLMWESFDMTKEEAIELMGSFFSSGKVNEVNFVEGSIDAINRIAEKHEVIFITSRPGEYQEDTLKLLKENSLQHPVHFSKHVSGSGTKTKHEICVEENVNLLIDDALGHVKECAEGGVDVLLMDNPWNRNFEHEKVVRVHSWRDVLDHINLN